MSVINLLVGCFCLGCGVMSIMKGDPYFASLNIGLSAFNFGLWFQSFPRTYVESKPRKEEDLYK